MPIVKLFILEFHKALCDPSRSSQLHLSMFWENIHINFYSGHLRNISNWKVARTDVTENRTGFWWQHNTRADRCRSLGYSLYVILYLQFHDRTDFIVVSLSLAIFPMTFTKKGWLCLGHGYAISHFYVSDIITRSKPNFNHRESECTGCDNFFPKRHVLSFNKYNPICSNYLHMDFIHEVIHRRRLIS